MAYWHISPWMKRLYTDIVWDERTEEKCLYLTFDDGPTPGVTSQVLDTLDRYNARGTFFCLGRNAEREEELFAEIQNRGHSVGNHTYSHLKGWKTRNEEYFKDIELASHIIPSKLFRPPYGQISRSQIRQLKHEYKIVMWEVMTHDYDQRVSWERSLSAVLKYSRKGSIIVMHDSQKAYSKLKNILPAILDHFSEKGFTFKAIKEPV